jgi:hypothetical protein
VKQILQWPSLLPGLMAAALLASISPALSSRVYAQSPLFPNTQPIYYNPYGQGPYGKFGQGNGQPFAPGVGFPFKPLPSVLSRPFPGPSPSVYSGFGSTPYGYGSNYGYGSSPYVRVYGGAGSYQPYSGPVYNPYGYGR